MLSTTGSLATTIGRYNPFRYRGYYYDTETQFYYLNSRYYDPEVCRFISPDNIAILTANAYAITDKNLYAYCDNNPVMRCDNGGQFWDTLFDVASLVMSVVDVISEPTDVGAWVGLAFDVVDVVVPFVGGLGETARAINGVIEVADAVGDMHDVGRVADEIYDVGKTTGWNVGDDITNLTKSGNEPSWSTVRQRYWKNEAYYNPSKYPDDLERMKKGLAPLDEYGYPMELHHPNGRNGENFYDFKPMTRREHQFEHYGRYLY